MANYKHPGVYIEEISQPGPIQGVTTNTVGFVGIAEKGIDPAGVNPELYNTPVMITSWDQFSQTFGGLIWNRFLAPAVYAFFKKGGTLCYIIRVQDPGSVGAIEIAEFANVNASSSGLWSTYVGIEIINSPASAKTDTPAFTLNVVYLPTPNDTSNEVIDTFIENNKIEDSSGTGGKAPKYILESFDGLTLPPEADATAESLKPIQKRIESQSLFIRLVPNGVPKRPANTADPIVLAGGTDGKPNYGTKATDKNPDTGFYAFNQLPDDTINIMAIPDLPTYARSDGKIDQSYQGLTISNAATYCQHKMSMFFIADPPFGLNLTEIKDFKEGSGSATVPLNSNYGALYYPWIMINQPGTSKNIMVPPSGSAAGVYAATDTAVGVWKAPAGINQGNLPFALDLGSKVTNNDQDVLNPYGINAIRELPGYGRVIWGARTLAIDTEWTYINVRRLFIFLENSIKRATWWIVFEPNSPKLWGTVSRNITAFLTLQWQQGALYGATTEEAFFVKIDEENNPREKQKLGELHIDIGVAPVFPGEFVIISFDQKTLSSES